MRKIIFLLSLFVPTLATAHEDVRVSDAWARQSMGQPNSVGYFTLNSAGDDVLTGITSDCCDAVELHNMTMDGDVMRMRRVDSIELPDHKDVALDPGGYHLMLIGVKKPLSVGDSVPLTLHFKHHAAQPLTLPVLKSSPAADASHGMHHH